MGPMQGVQPKATQQEPLRVQAGLRTAKMKHRDSATAEQGRGNQMMERKRMKRVGPATARRDGTAEQYLVQFNQAYLYLEPPRRWSRLKSWRTTGERGRERFNLSKEDRLLPSKERAVDVASFGWGGAGARKENCAPYFIR